MKITNSCERGIQKSKGGRPIKKKAPGKKKADKPVSSYTVQDIMQLDASKAIPKDIEKCMSSYEY